jgi:hypothetical protein
MAVSGAKVVARRIREIIGAVYRRRAVLADPTTAPGGGPPDQHPRFSASRKTTTIGRTG